MAELDNNAQFMQGGIDDAFIPPALKFDFIYQYMTNVDWKYLAQIPSYKQPAYMLKRLWLLLANGFVPEWHNTFIPTKLANTTLNTINRKIFSGALHYELGDDLYDESVDQKRRWFINDYLKTINPTFESEDEKASWYTMASGASASVAKIEKNGNLYFSTYREDKYLPTFVGGHLESVRLFSAEYSSIDGQGAATGQTAADVYCLEDYRFYHKGKPYSILRAFVQGSGDLNSIVNEMPIGLTYEQMPEAVAKAIFRKIGNRLNRAVELPFSNLGVYILNQTSMSAYFDLPNYSDSILAPAVEQLFEYDRSYTTMINDIALGRGQVLIPDTMDLNLAQRTGDSTMAIFAAHLSQQNMLNSKVFRKVPCANPESIKPEHIQFEMRIEQHLASLKGQRANIFNAIGINPGSIDPTIDESGHAKTATEAVIDEQNIISFVSAQRKKVSALIDWQIAEVLKYYFGIKDSGVHVKFTNGNLQNSLLTSQMTIQEYAAGIRSRQSAVAKLNANDSKADIDKEIERIKEDGGGADFVDNEQNGGLFGLYGGEK